MRPRPIDHLESVSRDYPGVWAQYDVFLRQRRELGDWPAWCHCPMAAAYAVVSGGGANQVPLDRSLDISRVAALAAWRPTQVIYRFDPTLLQELLTTPLSGNLPVEHLLRLPEWCVYVELPGDDGLHGFFAHLERDVNDERIELRLLLDYPDQLVPIALHLGSTIDAAIAGFVAHASQQAALQRMPVAFGSHHIQSIARMAEPLVSVLLYLCANDAEMRPTRDPRRRHERPQLRNGRMPPAKRLEVWETGFALGAELRAASESTGGGTVRGHIRRAHWHSYWVGSGDNRRLEVRWLHPIRVNLDGPPERPTARKVRR